MPLFSSHREPSPELVHEPEPTRKSGLFHRREPEPVVPDRRGSTKKPGLFHRRDPSPTHTTRTSSTGVSSHSSLDAAHGRKGNFLQRGLGRMGDDVDPSIREARERVMAAETAEADADRALHSARLQVREAREHMKRVQAEAEEDARRAKIKQKHAREVSKRGEGLGRHGV